ncbi:hypothetical protein VB713_12405 [Anabaena cylindrica UHCC 0172]|uniref:hypothetical protein n=1 Tax=Anabaena cylindrica TaxID=1165 RepID=UPI002B20F423|nr:hypothetical protein [Anabaena cylindrica]MEA5551774.1 hypothetical protein [Anabaena cylindrica UHCC 0172]
MFDLLSQFEANSQYINSQSSTPLVWGEPTPQQETTPEAVDGQRLEESIKEVLENKQLLNKALSTLLGVFAVNAGISTMTALGINALASGTVASIVVGVFLANALTKLAYDGQFHISKDFIVATTQTVCVGAGLWIAFDEYRHLSHATKEGKQRFYQEVREYEVKPVPQNNLVWVWGLGAALIILGLVAAAKGNR